MGATAMDTALGIHARSPQGSTASGPSSTASSAKTSEIFASLFSQLSKSHALQASSLARSTPLPTPAAQSLPADPRPAPDHSPPASAASDTNASATNKTDDQQTAKSSSDDDDDDRPQAAQSVKPAGRDQSAGKMNKADKSGKPGKADKASKTDKTDDTADAKAKTKAGATDESDQTAATDASADEPAPADETATDDQPTGDPILAVMPVASAQPALVAQAAGGDALKGAATGADAAGKGAAVKGGPVVKAADAHQTTAGPNAKAGADAIAPNAGASDSQEPTDGAASAKDGTAKLNDFVAALTGNAAAPTAPAAIALPHGLGESGSQNTATQLAQAVETVGGNGSGDGANAGLAGDNGSGGAQSGANAHMPDGTQITGGVEGARQTSGTEFANTLASVRSARPGMPASATDQVAVQLQHSAKDGTGSISMQLRPEELGRIDIKMSIDQSGVINATITADRPQTLELLQRDSHSLERALQDAGLQTDGGSLNFNLRGESGQGSNQQNNQGDGNRSGHNARHQATAEDTRSADIAVVTRHYQVANGRVDVRI